MDRRQLLSRQSTHRWSLHHQPDGVSILPTLLGEDQTEDTANRFLYWERHAGGGFKQAVRWRHWKAVRPPTDRLLDEPLELYDLETDLGETTDVADQHTEVIAEIQTYLEEARTPSMNYPIGVKSTYGLVAQGTTQRFAFPEITRWRSVRLRAASTRGKARCRFPPS